MVIATGITEDGGREVLGVVPKDAGEMVAATIRAIFAQLSQSAVRAQMDTVTDMLGSQFPTGKQMLLEAKDDLTTLAVFLECHWKKIQSTNPLERVNRPSRYSPWPTPPRAASDHVGGFPA